MVPRVTFFTFLDGCWELSGVNSTLYLMPELPIYESYPHSWFIHFNLDSLNSFAILFLFEFWLYLKKLLRPFFRSEVYPDQLHSKKNNKVVLIGLRAE